MDIYLVNAPSYCLLACVYKFLTRKAIFSFKLLWGLKEAVNILFEYFKLFLFHSPLHVWIINEVIYA